jgi:predicted PurR-regulated permease PerM
MKGRSQADAEITRVALGVLFLAVLIGVSLWILRPFLGALLWAVMIVIATWPLLETLERFLFGRRTLAVAAMSIGLLLVLVLPVTLAVGTLAANAGTLVSWAGALAAWRLPAPPEWLTGLPAVGPSIAAFWQQIGELSDTELLGRVAPYASQLASWLLSQLGNLGFLIVQFLLTIVVVAILYSNGEESGRLALRFARRLAGARGEDAAWLAARAIRGVALGVVGTALIQALLAGLGLALAGVPFVALLTAVAFLLTVAQLGVIFVLVPAVVWLFATGMQGAATFLLVWTVIVGSVDNFIRPLLIKRGADLSLVLIFAGVVGGLLTFGIVGIFVGPVVLAVGWTLLRAWIDEEAAAGG